MALSKKHYEAVARDVRNQIVDTRALYASRPDLADEKVAAVTALANRLANTFAQDNSAFDRARFLNACGC